MKQGVISDATKSSRQLAQDIARKMAQEPLEILKSAREQTTGIETDGRPDSQIPDQNVDQQKKLEEQQKIQDNLRSSRRLEAYKQELEDIKKQDVFKGLQQRISEGEEIPLTNYSELTMEQKQVLMAQMEAVKFQKKQAEFQSQDRGPLFGSSKKGRRFGQGQKQEAEKQQTRVEKPVPPSG
jgi:hypothetical protein